MLLQQFHHLLPLLPREHCIFLPINFLNVFESTNNVPRDRRIIKEKLHPLFVALQFPEMIFQPIFPLRLGLETVDDGVIEVFEETVLVCLHRSRAAFRGEDFVDVSKVTHLYNLCAQSCELNTSVERVFSTFSTTLNGMEKRKFSRVRDEITTLACLLTMLKIT